MEEPPVAQNESILKPKGKRTLTDEQRLVLANRMRAVNDKRIADAMAKKNSVKPEPEPKAPEPKVSEPQPPISTPKVQKKKRMVRVVELSENEEDDYSSESEEEIIIVPKKKAVPKKVAKKAVEPEEEEEEKPKKLTKSKPVPKSVSKEETPKILYRFL